MSFRPVPAGTILEFGGATLPPRYAWCDGASVLRAGVYAALFRAIGTTFGSVDGTHFNLPDKRGRVGLGAGTGDASDATAHTLGTKEGAEKHTLDVSELAAHTHGVYVDKDTGADTNIINTPNSPGYGGSGGSYSTNEVTGNSTGGDQPHNNLQPSLCVNFIIKY